MEMSFTVGNGGWVLVRDDANSARCYVKVSPNSRGRLTVRQMFIESDGEHELTPHVMKVFDVAGIEAWVNAMGADVLSMIGVVSPADGMPLLAAHYAFTFGEADPARNWVAAAYFSQFPANAGHDLEEVRKPRQPRKRARRDDFRLSSPPGVDGLTDEFLGRVAHAYSAALSRGEAPNVTLAKDAQVAKRTAEAWVAKARQRGIMPPGRKGARG